MPQSIPLRGRLCVEVVVDIIEVQGVWMRVSVKKARGSMSDEEFSQFSQETQSFVIQVLRLKSAL
jgi:hypothetical protein